MERILIVEDSKMLIRVLTHMLKFELGFSAVVCESMADAKKLLESGDTDFLAATLDLTLPDAPNGEIIDYVLAYNIPSIVLTSSFDEQRREEILNKSVVDYVVKESRYSYEYVIRLIGRLDRNRFITALVVDDSMSVRGYIKSLLLQHNFRVIEAASGEQALTTLRANPKTRLIITDYNMPGMDGFQLTTTIRKEFDKSSMAIIGLSGQGSPTLSAKFIKNGANDFLTKPFSHEELYCRVMQNMEALEHIEEIRDAANRDYLTHLYNRRYFFENGGTIFDSAITAKTPLTIAVMDIDFFKKINDSYGHDAGDLVLKSIAVALTEHFGEEIVARFGGEEFCILFDGIDLEDAEGRLDRFREIIEQSSVETDAGDIQYTLSIGATDTIGKTLDEMIKRADEYLYLAKDRGRNQLVSG